MAPYKTRGQNNASCPYPTGPGAVDYFVAIPSKQPNEPIHCQCRVAGLSDRRSVRYHRRAHRICDGEQFDLPGLNLRAGDRVGRLVNLHAPSRQIVNRLNWIAVWDLFYVDADALKPTLEHDVEGTGQAGPVSLSCPGLARANSTTFLSVLTGKSTGTEIPMTVLYTRAMGARSLGL